MKTNDPVISKGDLYVMEWWLRGKTKDLFILFYVNPIAYFYDGPQFVPYIW